MASLMLQTAMMVGGAGGAVGALAGGMYGGGDVGMMLGGGAAGAVAGVGLAAGLARAAPAMRAAPAPAPAPAIRAALHNTTQHRRRAFTPRQGTYPTANFPKDINPGHALTLHPTQSNMARGLRGEFDTVGGNLVRGPATGATPGATPGAPAVASNAAGGGDWHPLATGAAMAGIGGTASWLTGGSFVQGAVMGGLGGFGAVKGAKWGAGLKDEQITGALGKEWGGSVASYTKGARTATREFLGDTSNRRMAMMGGAGLSGFIFGGNRRNHRRGFNSRRGSRI